MLLTGAIEDWLEILRIDPHIGKVVKNWEACEGGGRLSVANDANIILNINLRAQLNEYTADGEFTAKDKPDFWHKYTSGVACLEIRQWPICYLSWRLQ